MTKQATIIEIGSSKVICTIVTKTGSEQTVQGFGSCGYSCGYKYNAVTESITYPDEKSLFDAVRRAVTTAKNEAKVDIDEAFVALNAPFLKVRVVRGGCTITSKNRYITEDDDRKLQQISRKNVVQEGYKPIHSTPIAYYVDGEECVNLPIGKSVKQSLDARISHVFLDKQMADMCDRILEALQIKRQVFVAIPLAEAMYLIPKNEASKRSIVVDVGYNHMNIAYMQNETLLDVAVVPIGGYNFTNDIAVVEQISYMNAESIKKRYKFGVDYDGATEMTKNTDGVVKYIDKKECSDIIEARMDELCSCLDAFIWYWYLENEQISIYLTGGGIMMEGAAEYMQMRLGINVIQQLPEISRDRLNTANNASAFAVAMFVLNPWFTYESDKDDDEEVPKVGFFKRLFGRQ